MLNARWSIHGNSGLTVPPNVNGHDLLGYNLGVSAIYALTPSLNLLVECVANWDENSMTPATATAPSVLVSPRFRYGFSLPHDAQLVVGVAAPIGLTRDAPDYGIFVYCSLEHFFSREKRAGK